VRQQTVAGDGQLELGFAGEALPADDVQEPRDQVAVQVPIDGGDDVLRPGGLDPGLDPPAVGACGHLDHLGAGLGAIRTYEGVAGAIGEQR